MKRRICVRSMGLGAVIMLIGLVVGAIVSPPLGAQRNGVTELQLEEALDINPFIVNVIIDSPNVRILTSDAMTSHANRELRRLGVEVSSVVPLWTLTIMVEPAINLRGELRGYQFAYLLTRNWYCPHHKRQVSEFSYFGIAGALPSRNSVLETLSNIVLTIDGSSFEPVRQRWKDQ